jgi:hypothetical protein
LIVALIDTYDCVLEFGRQFLRGFGFRQINLNAGCLKCRRNDKKMKDDQNIDQRNEMMVGALRLWTTKS